jgi:hypothetical protein
MPYILLYCSVNGIAIPYLQNYKVIEESRKKLIKLRVG